jgi:hypothetical protein
MPDFDSSQALRHGWERGKPSADISLSRLEYPLMMREDTRLTDKTRAVCQCEYGSWIPAGAGMTSWIVIPAPASARAGSGGHSVSWRYTVHADEIGSKDLTASDRTLVSRLHSARMSRMF